MPQPRRSKNMCSICPTVATPLLFVENKLQRFATIGRRADGAPPSLKPRQIRAASTEFYSCATNTPIIPPLHGRAARAALSPCDLSEKRCDPTDCRSCIPLNVKPATCRFFRKGARCYPDLPLRILPTLGGIIVTPDVSLRAGRALANGKPDCRTVSHVGFCGRFGYNAPSAHRTRHRGVNPSLARSPVAIFAISYESSRRWSGTFWCEDFSPNS